ncbi:unnamed protein product [Zymoseptoria tritici ST99CH_3D7]|uniref:Uncharacterized protein n=2 Tax=Zymoseptoria tritici TaxID=1047171 RepID=A0A1X7RS01_ZYMT9|nr:unnamed protein product [Zymoseptoria tritici ST99CH_3D7]SMR51181.1 unnamed protein product [Zymoseptoria tritici ST99CH_1E4]
MDVAIAVKAFLNRFQGTASFGTNLQQTSQPGTDVPNHSGARHTDIRRPTYRDTGTQTLEEDPASCSDGYGDDTNDGSESAYLAERNEEDDFWSYGMGDFTYRQQVRDSVGVSLKGDCADYYTEGQPQFVAANDGIKDCAALLMTVQLSGLIKAAILAEREFKEVQGQAQEDRGELMSLGRIVHRKIRCLEYRLDRKNVDAASVDGESGREELFQELRTLCLLREDVKRRVRCVEETVHEAVMTLHTGDRDMKACMEKAFVKAELVDRVWYDPDYCTEPLNFEPEYAAFCQRLREAEKGPQVDVSTSDATSDAGPRMLEAAEEGYRADEPALDSNSDADLPVLQEANKDSQADAPALGAASNADSTVLSEREDGS